MKYEKTIKFVLIIVLFLIASSFYLTYNLYSRNTRLDKHIKLLEKNIILLNQTLAQYQKAEKAMDRNKTDALDYLRWKFVLKDQVDGARQRLTGKAAEIMVLKKEKALANLVYYNLGLSCVLASDFGPAIDAFELAVKYDPKDSASYYDLGLLYSVYRKDQDRAIQYYSKYIELIPKGARSDEVRTRIDMLKNKPFDKAQGLY